MVESIDVLNSVVLELLINVIFFPQLPNVVTIMLKALAIFPNRPK